MILQDWRQAEPGLLRVCYDTERLHWQRELAWDTTWTWSTIERARVTWGLPGLIAVDDAGGVQGWTFWIVEAGALNVGGLIASNASVTGELVEGILEAAERADVAGTSVFILDRAAGLTEALNARGFACERFLYLSRPLAPGSSHHPLVGAAFSRPEITGVATLLQTAYTPDGAQHFAPNGTVEEWTHYVTGLIRQRACGVLDREASRVVRDDAGLQALALVTAISPATAHLAQLAVRPDCRGRRLAAQLLEEAGAVAAQAGKTRMTLLVGEHNAAARRIYRSIGFNEQATFIAARGITRGAMPAC